MLVHVDVTDWRVYWAHTEGGIFSSDIKGNNKKNVVAGETIRP